MITKQQDDCQWFIWVAKDKVYLDICGVWRYGSKPGSLVIPNWWKIIGLDPSPQWLTVIFSGPCPYLKGVPGFPPDSKSSDTALLQSTPHGPRRPDAQLTHPKALALLRLKTDFSKKKCFHLRRHSWDSCVWFHRNDALGSLLHVDLFHQSSPFPKLQRSAWSLAE